jgi:hypothetical protein
MIEPNKLSSQQSTIQIVGFYAGVSKRHQKRTPRAERTTGFAPLGAAAHKPSLRKRASLRLHLTDQACTVLIHGLPLPGSRAVFNSMAAEAMSTHPTSLNQTSSKLVWTHPIPSIKPNSYILLAQQVSEPIYID